MNLNDFEFIDLLIEKKIKIVSLYKVKYKKDGQIYIIKKINLKYLNKDQRNKLINDIKILSSLKHPNIIEIKNIFLDNNKNCINIVKEYANNGTLSNKINYAIKNGMYLEENIIWTILAHVSLGLNYLHKKGIIHKHLKSDKILITRSRLIKININESVIFNNKQLDNLMYTAPEILNNQKYNFKQDIWSLGVIIYELTSLSLPFKENNIKSLYNSIINRKIKPIPNFYSEHLKLLINKMLSIEPDKRPSTDELLHFPFIKEIINKLIYLNTKKCKTMTNSRKALNNNLLYNNINIKIYDKEKNRSNKKMYELKKTIKNARYRTLYERKKYDKLENNTHNDLKTNIKYDNNNNNINKRNIFNNIINKSLDNKINNNIISSNSLNDRDMKLITYKLHNIPKKLKCKFIRKDYINNCKSEIGQKMRLKCKINQTRNIDDFTPILSNHSFNNSKGNKKITYSPNNNFNRNLVNFIDVPKKNNDIDNYIHNIKLKQSNYYQNNVLKNNIKNNKTIIRNLCLNSNLNDIIELNKRIKNESPLIFLFDQNKKFSCHGSPRIKTEPNYSVDNKPYNIIRNNLDININLNDINKKIHSIQRKNKTILIPTLNLFTNGKNNDNIFLAKTESLSQDYMKSKSPKDLKFNNKNIYRFRQSPIKFSDYKRINTNPIQYRSDTQLSINKSKTKLNNFDLKKLAKDKKLYISPIKNLINI